MLAGTVDLIETILEANPIPDADALAVYQYLRDGAAIAQERGIAQVDSFVIYRNHWTDEHDIMVVPTIAGARFFIDDCEVGLNFIEAEAYILALI